MYSWLLIIFFIGFSVTLGEFPSRFLKCSLHIYIRSSCLPRYSILSIFDRVSNAIDLVLNVFYLIFWYALISSFCAFVSSWASTLVGFLLLLGDAVFTLSRLIANVSHEILCFTLSLVGVHSTAASMWSRAKFLPLSFRVSVSDISWRGSNLLLYDIVYLSLIRILLSSICIHILLSREQCMVLVWLSRVPA